LREAIARVIMEEKGGRSQYDSAAPNHHEGKRRNEEYGDWRIL
jgi:hypothetical protein